MADNELTLKISEASKLLTSIIKYNQELADRGPRANKWEEKIVPLFESEPGIGKTSMVWQAADALDIEYRGFIGAQYDPAELAGINFFDRDTREMWRAKPEFLPTSGDWVILCDEFGQMTMMQKNIMAQLIQEWRLGEHMLSPRATVVLAGNRQRDRAGVNPTPTHVLDRVMRITVTADYNDWIEWALANNINPAIIAYLRFRPTWFQKFDPSKPEIKQVSPRGWAKVSTILDLDLSKAVEMAAIAGQVGNGAATDFHGFLRVWRDLPDPDKVLADPKKEPIPDPSKRPDVMYALCGAIAARCTKKNADAVVIFARRLPAEFATILITDATTRDKTLHKEKAIIDWKIKEGANSLLINSND